MSASAGRSQVNVLWSNESLHPSVRSREYEGVVVRIFDAKGSTIPFCGVLPCSGLVPEKAHRSSWLKWLTRSVDTIYHLDAIFKGS